MSNDERKRKVFALSKGSFSSFGFLDLTGFKYRDGDFRHGCYGTPYERNDFELTALESINKKLSVFRAKGEKYRGVIVSDDLLEHLLDYDPAFFEGVKVFTPGKNSNGTKIITEV